MGIKGSYGQFCPLAMAAEFLCTRWSVLIFRELLLGSSAFNDISRGVPRMSRSLLSKRLKEFTERGLLKKQQGSDNYDHYRLTEAGQALSSVIFGMADWSQEWLEIEPSLQNIDPDHLMWSLRRGARCHPDLPDPFIAHIYLPEQKQKFQNAWLVFKDDEVDLCIIDQEFEVDVQIETSAETLTKVFMGWSDFFDMVNSDELIIRGPKKYTDIAPSWLGQSRLANIKKQAIELRVDSSVRCLEKS